MAIFGSTGAAAFPKNPQYTVGKKMRTVQYFETFATTGTNGDQHILAGPLTMDDRIARIMTQRMAAMTTATNANLGFYYKKPDGTYAVVKASGGNELWSGVTLAAAITTWTDLLTAKNASIDTTKSIRDLLSLGPDAEPVGGVYLVLTLPTAQTAGGITDLDIIIEESTTR